MCFFSSFVVSNIFHLLQFFSIPRWSWLLFSMPYMCLLHKLNCSSICMSHISIVFNSAFLGIFHYFSFFSKKEHWVIWERWTDTFLLNMRNFFFPFSFWAFEKKIRQLLDVFPSTFGKTSIKWLLDVFLGGILGHVERKV